MCRGELLEQEYVRDGNKAPGARIRNPGEKPGICTWGKQYFFSALLRWEFMELDLHGENCIETACFILVFAFFSFAIALGLESDSRAKCTLARQKPHHPLPSFLCPARENTQVQTLLYDKAQLQEIWRSDRGFGSTFRKQKAKRQPGLKFQTDFLQKLKARTSSYWHLLLPKVSSLHPYKRFPDLTPWHFYILDSALKSPTAAGGTRELVCKGSWHMNSADTWTSQWKAAVRCKTQGATHRTPYQLLSATYTVSAQDSIQHFLLQFARIRKLLWVTQMDWEEESGKSLDQISV